LFFCFSILKKQSGVDVGPYSTFINKCFHYEKREYTYHICMFKDARQITNGGGGAVTIGYWNSWTGAENNKCLKMKYSGLPRVNQHWGGVAKFFGLESRILRFLRGVKFF
jgi:Glucosidase II beta subunit-like protein